MNGYIDPNEIDDVILLGDDADHFMESDLGRYVIERAKTQMAESVRALLENPEGDPRNVELRLQYHIAKCIPFWLNDAIISGRQLLEMKITDEIEKDI